jgi:CRP-like cAMP-binding protein
MDQQERFKGFYLFRGATPDDLRAVDAIAEHSVCIVGDILYREGDVADALFFIELGMVDIVASGKDTSLITVASGQGFGELSFFEHGTRPASAFVRERTDLLRIPYERLSKVLAERPELALLVYRNACAFFAKHFRTMALNLNRRYF